MPTLTRDLVVAAALAEVERDGYEHLTLRGLARKMGVTAPALYEYVDSKGDLLRLVASGGYEEMRRIFEVEGERAIDRCRKRAVAYVAFARERPELFRAMFLYRPAAIEIEADNELAAATDIFDEGTDDIRQAIADGDLVRRDPIRLNLTLWAAVHGAATVALVAPSLADPMADDVIDAVFRGLQVT